MSKTQGTYPNHWQTHAVLKDGSTVEIRPIKPTDRAALKGFHARQSRESIFFRFFRYRPELSESELDYFTQVDYSDRMAFVAFIGSEMVAVARYERATEEPKAEVAFFVDDEHHGKGLATLMLEYLAAAARERGLTGFTASVLPENYRMLGVFRSAGFEARTSFAEGVIDVELGIDVTARTASLIADRHRQATAKSVARILEPRTVAIVGASRTPGTLGHEMVRFAAASRRVPGAGATVVAVNPKADEIAGVKCYPTIAAASQALIEGAAVDERAIGAAGSLGEDVAMANSGSGLNGEFGEDAAEETNGIDLVVIAVPAEVANDIVAQCADAGVKGLLIVSAGFSDFGGLGVELERRLVEVARTHGMRLIGPAAFGIVNTAPDVDLSVVFQPVPVEPGRVGLASQSGPLGAAVLGQLRSRRVGVSTFVGVGNRADVSVNDLLDYWSLDAATDVVVLYVENFGNLRNFSAAAHRLSPSKPIITISPPSHDEVELLSQAGVILVDEVSQLVVQAHLAATQPVPRGNRVVIVSNTASLARLTAVACRRHGLEVVVPGSVGDIARDGAVLIADIDSGSLRPNSRSDTYERTVVAAAVSEEVDLLVLALAPNAGMNTAELADLLDGVNRSIDKPMVAVGLMHETETLQVDGVPMFTFPDAAAQALSRLAGYGRWRSAREKRRLAAGGGAVDASPGVEETIERLLAGRDEATLGISSPDLPSLLEVLGLSLASWGSAVDLEEATELADHIGYPVVLKAANLGLRTLGESGGTAIDIHDRDSLVGAYERMSRSLGVAMRTAVVQRMIPSTGAVRLELMQDPSFGAMLAIGPGGLSLTDVVPFARRFLPVDEAMARELVGTLSSEPAFGPLDDESEQALVRHIQLLAKAASASPNLARVSLNPILLSGVETMPTDIEVVLRRPPVDILSEVRHI